MKKLFSTLILVLLMSMSRGLPAAAQDEITITDLGSLGSGWSYAMGINDLGQVAGYSYTASLKLHAFLWEDNIMTDLGTLGGAYSVAIGVNNLGQVVGYSQTASGQVHAFLWEDGVMTRPGHPGGFIQQRPIHQQPGPGSRLSRPGLRPGARRPMGGWHVDRPGHPRRQDQHCRRHQ